MSSDEAEATFDYVVVGAGSAGCVLANRLTAGGAGAPSVCLLEAGEPTRNPAVRVPGAYSRLFGTDLDWDYHTAPQSGLDDRELYWPRGRTLGGSSAINAMVYVRGHPADYDGWAAAGNEGWDHESLLPYFRRGETNERLTSRYHGRDGPLHVTDLRDRNELTDAFVESAAAAGIPRTDDFNGARQAGVAPFQVTQKGGQRHSAADAYLTPVLDRPNLTVRTGARATRVTFDRARDPPRATGVVYRQDGRERRVPADEVVLAAGAVGSPKLLLLSGVGPAAHLREHGIEVVADRPVGRNLQDHLVVPVVYEATGATSLDSADRLPDVVPNVLRYLLARRGPLASNVAEAGAFVRSSRAGPDDPPDLQLHFAPAYFLDHGRRRRPGDHFGIAPTLIRPESRGRVELRSADPLEDPVIDPDYLAADADLDLLVEGIRRAREIARTPPLDDHRGAELHPGSGATTDAALAAAVREGAQTIYHPAGTCRMGPDEDAVVDDRLRVHGVAGLRVVDASVMPTVTGGNTNAPTMAIAERAADLLRSPPDDGA